MHHHSKLERRILCAESLESRELLAVLSLVGTDKPNAVAVISNADGTIAAGNLVNTGAKNAQGGEIHRFQAIKKYDSLNPDKISHIVFKGLAGNDLFINQTNLKLIAYGGHGSDIIVSGGGDDILYGGQHDDFLDGGGGNDHIYGDTGKSKSGGKKAGHDALIGGPGIDKLFGQQGHDYLIGGRGKDDLSGHAGFDVLDGGIHDDKLNGHAGNDLLFGRGGVDQIFGGPDDDYLDGGSNNDNLKGDAGLDCLFGRLGADTIKGGSGNDYLSSGRLGQKDTLTGDVGSDVAYGYAADLDTLNAEQVFEGSGEFTGKETTLTPEQARCTLENFQVTIGGENPYIKNGKLRNKISYPSIESAVPDDKTEETNHTAYETLASFISPRLSYAMANLEGFAAENADLLLLEDLPAEGRIGEAQFEHGQEWSDQQLSQALFDLAISDFAQRLGGLEETLANLIGDYELISEFPEAKPEIEPKYAALLSEGQDLIDYLEEALIQVDVEIEELARLEQYAKLLSAFTANTASNEFELVPGDEEPESFEDIPDEPSLSVTFQTDGIVLGNNWQVQQPMEVAGRLRHVLSLDDHRAEWINANILHNPFQAKDVNLDNHVTPIDALLIINFLNRESTIAALENTNSHFYFDVTGDGWVSPLDALQVINQLNNQSGVQKSNAVHGAAFDPAVGHFSLLSDSEEKKKRRG